MTTNQTFGYTPTPQTHTARAPHSWAHENACVVTLVHPHTHAQASTSSAQSNQTFKKKTSLSWFDAVGELGFNSRSQLIFFDNSKISDCIQQLYIYTYACMSLYMHTYTHTHLCTCIYAHIRVCVYIDMQTHIYVHIRIYTHIDLKLLMSGLPLLYRVSTTVLLPYKTRENSIRSWIHVHHKRPLLFNVK